MVRPLTKELVKNFLDGLGYDFYSDDKQKKSKKEETFTFRNPKDNTFFRIKQYKYKKTYIVFMERVCILNYADDPIVKINQKTSFENPEILKKIEDDFLSYLNKENEYFEYEDIKFLEEWVDSEIYDDIKGMKKAFLDKILAVHNLSYNVLNQDGWLLRNEIEYRFEVFADEVIKLQKLKNKILGL